MIVARFAGAMAMVENTQIQKMTVQAKVALAETILCVAFVMTLLFGTLPF